MVYIILTKLDLNKLVNRWIQFAYIAPITVYNIQSRQEWEVRVSLT